MSTYFLIVFLIICINHGSVTSIDHLQLKLVAIVHRHGDRAPLNFLPGDPYSDNIFWPDGKSQLLASGKDRLYQLGESLRVYYDNFLTNNPREVHARSSDADRCIESAEMLFHGLYKAKGRWIYNSKTDYLPIPIHTTPTRYDRMLAEGVYCPVLNQETQAVFERPEPKALLTKYETTLAILTQKLGFKIDNLEMVLFLFDTWKIEKSQNYKIPSWITESIWNDLIEMVNLYSTIQNDSPLIHRLRAGSFLGDLKRYLIQSTESSNGEEPVKLITYSTHDTMLGSFMSTLKIFNKVRVPYGAALLIELLASPDNKLNYVQIKYWNDTYVNEQHMLTLPFCQSGQLCELNEFLNYIEQFIPTDWESECSLNDTANEDSQRGKENEKAWEWVGIVAVTCLSIITLIIVILFASFVYDLYKKSYQINRSDREKQEYDRIL